MGSQHMQIAQSTLHSLTMNAKIVFPSIFLIFICLFENSSCIECFQCNTGVEIYCDDPFSHLRGRSYLYHCPENENEKILKYYCQKMVYKETGVHTVQRSCQHIRQDQSYLGQCHDTIINGEYALICECEEDGCNSGSQLEISLIYILSAAVVAYLRR